MLKRKTWNLLEKSARLAAIGCRRWYVLAVLAFVASPIGPHLRIEQSGSGFCSYAGSRGVLEQILLPTCPVLAWLDSGEFSR